MSYRDNSIRVRKLPLEKGLREGLALAKARQWRPSLKSRAQVRRRARGLKYAVKATDRIYNPLTGKFDKPARVARTPIRKFERWQFPDLTLKKALSDLAAIGYVSTQSVALYYASGPEDAQKITDSQANDILINLLDINAKQLKNKGKIKKRSIADKINGIF